MKVSLAQISPIFLNREQTLKKVAKYIQKAAAQESKLVVFGEALVPAYPFWLAFTDGSSFDNLNQKKWHAKYLQEAVQIERGDLKPICLLAAQHQIAIYLGIVERPADRGGHSLYCSLVYINEKGTIASVHRKLQPTYEERLCWSQGDGNGLRTHALEGFQLGGLNCWENWMPLARTSLYAQGENVHIAVWPGSDYNTNEITRFIARESRSYVLSVSSILTKEDLQGSVPEFTEFIDKAPDVLANGGTCVAKPDGSWLVPPQTNGEQLIHVSLELQQVYQERQNFDAVGHYSRPDVLSLNLNQQRQSTIK